MGYWQDVEGIAQDAIDEYPDNEDERQEYITESVDGSSNIIYYGENEGVLAATNNEPDASDITGMCKPDARWREMRQVAAYLAMEADIHEVVARLIEEREDAEVSA